MEIVGADGIHLLQAVYAEKAPLGAALRAVEALEILRQMWVQHFYYDYERDQFRLRDYKELPPTAKRLETPYDVEARYSEKEMSNGPATRYS